MMDRARLPLTNKFPEGRTMTTEIAIQPKYVNLVSEFAKKTGLGYNTELRYDPSPQCQDDTNEQSNPSDTESAEDSEFGSQFGAFE